MALGRGFLASDDRAGAAEAVTVLSHALWQRSFRGARDILGQSIQINGRPFTVVGVAAPGFVGNTISHSELWVPLTIYPAMYGGTSELLTSRAAVWMVAVGRLKPGVTPDQAHAQMASIARDLEREYPRENKDAGVALLPSHRLPGPMRTYATAFVALLFALVGLVLAIACTNVAGMMLARSLARSREIAVRMAVGASRTHVAGQLIVESVLLSTVGAVGGILMAIWLTRGLRALTPALPITLALDIRLDWRVVGFSVGLAIVTGVLFGLVPALQAARTDLSAAIKNDASGAGPRRLRLRQTFVVAQVAMSVLLVVCGVLFARSLVSAGSIDPGFDVRNVEVVDIDFRLTGREQSAVPLARDQILARVEKVSGARSAAFAALLPLMGGGIGPGPLRGIDRAGKVHEIHADWNMVTPRYFETMRLPIVRGRAFREADAPTTPPVAIVNETLARRLWPGDEALGKTLEHDNGGTRRILQVVGIAKDAKYRSLGEEPRSFIYVPLAQNARANLSLLVKTDGRRITNDVKAILQQVDPNLPIIRTATLAEATAVGLLPHRLAAGIAGSLGLVGLLLAAIGIYGITAYNVAQRTREIGVRVALGAVRRDVLRLVVGQAMRMSVTGAAIGLLIAAGATRLLVSLLYGVKPLDPVSFAAGAVLFCSLAFVASWMPARRAASLNPVEALRTE